MKPEDSSEQVIQLDPPTELRLYVEALIPKDKTTVSKTQINTNYKPPADKHKNCKKKKKQINK